MNLSEIMVLAELLPLLDGGGQFGDPYRPPQATGAFFQAGLRAVQKVPRQSRPGPFQPSALPCPFRTGGKSANNGSSSIIRAARGYSGHR